MIAVDVRRLRREGAAEAAKRQERVQAAYTAGVGVLYPAGYTPLTFDGVEQWLGLRAAVLHLFVAECLDAPRDRLASGGSSKLVRMLWLRRHRTWCGRSGGDTVELLTDLPSAEEWNTYVSSEGLALDCPAARGGTRQRRALCLELGVGDAPVSPLTLALAFLETLETTGIYVGTWATPPLFADSFAASLFGGATFEFLSDISAALLESNIVQLGVTLIVLSAIAFALVKDDTAFYAGVSRYQLRRDTVDNKLTRRTTAMCLADPRFHLSSDAPCPYKFAHPECRYFQCTGGTSSTDIFPLTLPGDSGGGGLDFSNLHATRQQKLLGISNRSVVCVTASSHIPKVVYH